MNSFLQFLEQDESESILVAATNHVSLLDRALFRRFDDIIQLALPTEALAIQVMKTRLSSTKTRGVLWRAAARAARGLSYAEIVKACDDAAKDAVLSDRDGVSPDILQKALLRRRKNRKS